MRRFYGIISLCVIFLAIAPNLSARSYRSELNRATHEGRLYGGKSIDAKLLWSATLVTDDFRRARAEEHATLNHLGAVEAARWLASEEERQSKEWECFVTFYAKSEYQKFSTGSDSFWNIFLVDDVGDHVSPHTIELIPVTPYIELIYPQVNRWSKAYRVTFPKVRLGRHPDLTLQSVVGSSTLTWRLR